MAKWHKLFISKVLVVVLSFLLFDGNFQLVSQYVTGNSENRNQVEDIFSDAFSLYGKGEYRQAVGKLEAILSAADEIEPALQAKIFLLLGACYEKSGKKEKAGECFQKLKKLIENGSISSVPTLPGIEPESLSEYREVFEEESLLKLKEPLEVSEMLRKNVVHAPKKSKEQKEKEKIKKKFPWLIAVGAVVIIGTAAVLLLTTKKGKDKPLFPDIEWVRIPAGEFLMGDNFNEGEADESPEHTVYLDEYYISKFEVTRDQYRKYCDATGKSYDWPQGLSPAIEVSWGDAAGFCWWFSAKTGENIHLPTEAQWEKAARGADQRRYPWGNSPPDENKAYFTASSTSRPIKTGIDQRPEGQSPYGIYDMAGNAAEWCLDWYSPGYYTISPERNPVGPPGGSYRVLRGGSCRDDAAGIRSARRDFYDPGSKERFIGFRVVKEASK